MRVVQILCSIIIIALFIMLILALLPPSCSLDLDDTDKPDDGVIGDGNDDGDIGVNVTTGKVKIDIINLDGESIVGEVLDFVGDNGENDVLFAPGRYYFTEGFKIKNEGNIEVTFKMYITREEGEDMKAFEEAFEFYITTDNKNYDEANKLKEFTGNLGAGLEGETYYLVVKMKPEAGNDYQGRDFNGIGITVNATQVIDN